MGILLKTNKQKCADKKGKKEFLDFIVHFLPFVFIYFRRKLKAKAPLPPAETKNLDASSVDDSVESSAFIMEQKESMIDKDVELSVVLPGDVIKSTTVHGRYDGANEIP